jgi:uncharacterized protein (DUF3820 family)
MNGTNIIPFGKHKGRTIEELIADDPQYIEWLSSQSWFTEKFNVLYQVILNRGAEPENTPEHNRLQMKFHNDDFCIAFAKHFFPDQTFSPSNISRQFEEHGIDVTLSIGGMYIFRIEVKPTVSDDFPVVLRQMKVSRTRLDFDRTRYLLLENYTGIGATREEFIKTFESSGMRVVFLDEIMEKG